jgi:hypothetical protein
VGVPEYVATPALLGVALGTRYLVSGLNHPYWSGPILFDQPTRKALVFGSGSARSTAETVSDVFTYASVAYPYVVDTAMVTWIGRQNPEVAWQMFVINSQAYSLTLALTAVTKRVAGRDRPYGDQCATNPDGHPCGQPTEYGSFFSGHAAQTATGAGLVCAHHTQLRIYTNPTADATACVTAVSLSLATGVLRMTSDNHWVSDVLVGDLVGFVSGYLLPTLIYYRQFHLVPPPSEEPSSPAPRVTVLPMLSPSTLGLTAIGLF